MLKTEYLIKNKNLRFCKSSKKMNVVWKHANKLPDTMYENKIPIDALELPDSFVLMLISIYLSCYYKKIIFSLLWQFSFFFDLVQLSWWY